MAFYRLNDRQWKQYLVEGKSLPEIVAEHPEAVLTGEEVKEMLDGKDINPEPGELTAREARSQEAWEAQEYEPAADAAARVAQLEAEL